MIEAESAKSFVRLPGGMAERLLGLGHKRGVNPLLLRKGDAWFLCWSF